MTRLSQDQSEALIRILAKLGKAGLFPSLSDLEILLSLIEGDSPQGQALETGGRS